MLFLVALRDILTDENLKSFIDTRYLKNNNVSGSTEYKIKLKQVETDWVAYKKIILKESLTDKEKGSAVYHNYRYFYNKLSEMLTQEIDLGSLIDKGLNRFSVITIELQPDKNPWENPQEIFESMNSLGKPLSLADLVRNYLLLGMDADTQSELYIRYWLHIENTLPGQVSNFIRDYMQGKEQKSFVKAKEANYKELYSIFKKVFGEGDSKQLLKELSENADIYACIIEDVSSGFPKIDTLLKDLRKINVTTAYSFLLMLLRTLQMGQLSAKDTLDILEVFRIYCMRRRLLGLTSAENKNFPLLAGRIPDLIASDDKRAKMFEILANQESNLRLPNDIELTRYLENMNFFNFQYCSFYLALIEEKLTKSRPDLSDKHLQIEHIMPQKLSETWITMLGEDYESLHSELVHTIGNLTLIRHNQELGNKSFSEKRAVYQNNAGLQIAKTKIVDCENWTDREIRERTQWISNYIVQEVFPIPDSMRKINNFKIKEKRGLSFQDLQLIGLDINFIYDTTISAHVTGDKEVEFEGKKWRLSPLTKEIQTRRGLVSPSGAYNGALYWEYDGIKLADIM